MLLLLVFVVGMGERDGRVLLVGTMNLGVFRLLRLLQILGFLCLRVITVSVSMILSW